MFGAEAQRARGRPRPTDTVWYLADVSLRTTWALDSWSREHGACRVSTPPHSLYIFVSYTSFVPLTRQRASRAIHSSSCRHCLREAEPPSLSFSPWRPAIHSLLSQIIFQYQARHVVRLTGQHGGSWYTLTSAPHQTQPLTCMNRHSLISINPGFGLGPSHCGPLHQSRGVFQHPGFS